MARIVRDARLETREARTRFEVSKEPYWKPIHRCGHIGYYKGKITRTWYARYRNEGENAGYKKMKIALADDNRDSDGKIVLSFREAQLAAQEWFKSIEMQRAGHTPSGKYTVQDALDDYAKWYKAHRKSWDRTIAQINTHIIPAFGDMEVSRLTYDQIRDWHQKIAATPPRRRTSKYSSEQNYGALNNDNARRSRKNSANRILSMFKAILNMAYNDNKVADDNAWRRIKPFGGVDSPRIRYLTIEESRRLVNATDPEFRPMVQAALHTACRYGELVKMQVQDYNAEAGTILIPETKSDKPRHVTLTGEGIEFFESAILDKNGDDLIFTHENGEQWGRSHQTRRLTEACENARISPAVSFHILRHTHASQLALHDVPIAVIAHQLGNSVGICEKHYAHLGSSYISDTIREKFPKLGINADSNVEKFHGNTRKSREGDVR